MKTTRSERGRIRITLAILLVLVAVVIYFYSERTGPPPEALDPPMVEEADPTQPRHPVPEPIPDGDSEPDSGAEDSGEAAADDAADDADPSPEPFEPVEVLPALDASDPVVDERMAEWLGAEAADALLAGDDLVRRLVATIHSLDGEAVPLRVRPVVPAPEAFRPGEEREDPDSGERYWDRDAGNVSRYEDHLDALRRIEPEVAAQYYLAHYEWFQRAYAELGDPDAYFNDRLVEIIDHLLEAPNPDNGTRLVRPKVFYEYADPELEGQSWGRKALMRLGPEQRSVVKSWLREFRAAIASD